MIWLSIGFRFLTSRAGGYAILAFAATAAILWFVHHERFIGAQKIETQIEEQNKESSDDAAAAELRVRNCYQSGGMWRNGTCNH